MKILLYCGINNLVNFSRIRPYFDICYGFDANPDKVEYAQKIYAGDPGVKIVYGALTEKGGEEVEFTITTDWDPAASLGSPNPEYIPIKKNPELLTRQKKIKVPTINLHDFCISNHIAEIDTLITDLQGIDYTVVKTLSEFIRAGKIREIQCEVEPDGTPVRYLGIPPGKMSAFQELLSDCYDILWIDPPGPPQDAWEMDVRWRRKNSKSDGHIDFIVEKELLVPLVKSFIINIVYGHQPGKKIIAHHKGNVTVVWSANPIDGCDAYVYHNAFSYRGKRDGVDCLLMLEPSVVLPGEFDEQVWKYFEHVFTLFDALPAQSPKFHKIFFPRHDLAGSNPITESRSVRDSLYPLEPRKKAICMISGNKTSHVPYELYSKRIKAASWFHKHSSMPFDVYGKPPFTLPNYRGIIPDGQKLSVLKQYRFSLCFENTNDPVLSAGYVTEKMLDCLEARTIPIYLGASNIEQYIPAQCFIDFKKFSTMDDLDRYLQNLSDPEYRRYIDSMDAFVASGGLRNYSEIRLYSDIIETFINHRMLDSRYFTKDIFWHPGPSPAARIEKWKTTGGPSHWTWKYLSTAEPPTVSSGLIIDRNTTAESKPARSETQDHRPAFLTGKNKILKVLVAAPKFHGGSFRRGYSYVRRNIFDSLNRFENIDAQYYDCATEVQQYGLAGMSERLTDRIRKEKPDMLWHLPLTPGMTVLPDYLKFISGISDTQTLLWMTDPEFFADTGDWESLFDYVISPSGRTAGKSGKGGVLQSQWGFNPFAFRLGGMCSPKKISFIGSASPNRKEAIEELIRNGLAVDTYGEGWHEDSFISAYDMAGIFAHSGINLNLGDTPALRSQNIPRRLFEATGCCGFLITTPAEHLEKYFEPGREIVVADSLTELMDKARYYSTHENERTDIARRGYERTIAQHTWAHRLKDIFNQIGFSPVSKPAPQNTDTICSVSKHAILPPGSTDQEKITASLAVGAYNQLHYTKMCVESILHYTDGPYELMLTDNGSSDGTSEYYEWIKSYHPDTRIIRYFENRIVEANGNYGVSIARGRYTVGVTNDIIVHEGWLNRLIDQIESEPDIGIVGPRSNNISGPQAAPGNYDTMETYHSFATEWSARHRGENFPVNRMVGMLTIAKKAVLERIGGHDPDLPTNGRDGGYGFSDDDISLRYKLAGYRMIVANDVYIHHYGSATASKYRPDLFGPAQNINKEKYLKKLKSNDRVTISAKGEMTLRPYGPDEVIPVDERTVIRFPRICFVRIKTGPKETPADENRYADVIRDYRGQFLLSGQPLHSLVLQALEEKEYDFMVILDAQLTPTPDQVRALTDAALCHPDVAVTVPVGHYAPSTHIPQAGKGVEIIPYADLSVCALNLKLIRPLAQGLARVPDDDKFRWFLQRRIRGEGYFIARANDIVVDAAPATTPHPYDNRVLPEQLIRDGKFPEAAAIYHDDVVLDPSFAESYYQLACLARKQHQNKEAVRQAELALTADPHHIASLILLAGLSMEQNNWMRASSFIAQADLKQPGNPEVQKIVDRYEKAVKANPDLLKAEEPSQTPELTRAGFTAGRTSIIVAATSRHTLECLAAVKRHTTGPYELIVLDTLSSADQKKKLKKSVKEHRLYKILEHRPKAALLHSMNQAMDESTGEFIVLLADDTIVSEGWLAGMLSCLQHTPESGIVGPMTNGKYGLQQIEDESYSSVNALDKYAASFKKRFYGRRIPYRNPAGFCMLFRRTLAGRIGLLDERFEKDYFEYEDFCWRTTLDGHKNFIAGDIFVHSHGVRPLPQDRKVLDKKWILSSGSPEGKKLSVVKTMELAETLYAHGKTKEAVEALVNCITFRPDDADVYYTLCRMFIESRQFSEAWEVVGAMPEAAKNAVKGLECAGYIKEGLGLDDEADGYANRILSDHENHAAALNLKGILAFKQGAKDKAADFFLKAMEADPGFGEACTNLGVLFWGLDRKEEALAHLQRGFMLSPTVPDHSSIYYSALSATGTFGPAEDDFREACRLYPNHKNLVFLYVDILIQLGKPDVAMLRIEDALASFGLDDGLLNAALAVRDKIGPRQIGKPSSRGTLSFCMIVKNEEKYLVKCLRSIRDIADEIIIVDTGSSDKTVEIARVFGARLFDFPWTGDFSAARNRSLEEATGDWIFALDADEVIDALDYDELKKITDVIPTTQAAYAIETRNYLHHETVIGWTAYDGRYPDQTRLGWMPGGKVRLFTRNKDIYFTHPVHELVEHSLKKAGIPIYPGKVVVHHYGKLDEMKDWQKGEDYYLLGKMKYENDPTNAKYILELAKQAQLLQKNEEATELWLKLLDLIGGDPQSKAYQTIAPVTYGDPLSEIYTMLAASLLALNRFEESLAAARKFMEMKTHQRKEYVNVYAQIEIVAGSLEKALAAVEDQLGAMPGYSPVLLLKAVIFCLEGHKEGANNILRDLRAKNFEMTAILNRMARRLHANKKTKEALIVLSAMVENRIRNAETKELLLEIKQEG